MLVNLCGYWIIGLPLGYVLAFPFGWGALGIWIGLCVGLMIIGPVLLLAWHEKVLRAPVRGGELMDVA